MEGLLGLGVELELLARLHHLVEGRGADAGVQRDAAALRALPLGVDVVEPYDEALILLQLDSLNPVLDRFAPRGASDIVSPSYLMRTPLTTPSSLGLEVTLALPSLVSIVAPRVMTPLRSYSLLAGFAVTRTMSVFTVLLVDGS